MTQLLSPAVQILTGVIAICAFVWLYHGLLPTVEVRLELVQKPNSPILVRMEVENKSRVPAKKSRARLQILEHQVPEAGWLSEWVPFEEKAVRSDERPIVWREPFAVMKSTKFIGPGQTIRVETLYRPSGHVAIHLGFQVQIQSKFASQFGYGRSFTATSWALVTDA